MFCYLILFEIIIWKYESSCIIPDLSQQTDLCQYSAQQFFQLNNQICYFNAGGSLNVDQDNNPADQFLSVAEQGLMVDIVDMQNRDDFDSYMRQLEQRFYRQANLPEPPYQGIPEFPPKPYQTKMKRQQVIEEQRKDFIEKVNDANQRRSQAFGGNTQNNSNASQLQQQRYYESLSHHSIDANANPFFDTIFQGGHQQPKQTRAQQSQNLLQYPSPVNHQSYNAHTPSVGGLQMAHHGGYQPAFNSGNPMAQSMEPQQMSHIPGYLSKFVAGPARLEANPLSEPTRTTRMLSPMSSNSRQQFAMMNDFDLQNPDVQYERYKNLMSNQYYNSNVNSMNMIPAGLGMTQAHTVYQPPSTFTQDKPQMQQQQQYQQLPPPQQSNPFQPQPNGLNTTFAPNDMFNVSFNPLASGCARRPISGAPPGAGGRQPLHFQNNHGVSLYQAPSNGPAGDREIPGSAEFYRGLQNRNLVDERVIESIGGITDTLKPLEQTLKQHELRPYSIQRDYKKELRKSSRGSQHGGSTVSRRVDEIRPETMRLVSVSPFRAVVRVENNEGENDESFEDDDQQPDDLQRQSVNAAYIDDHNAYTPQPRGQSPIKSDSQSLRGEREQYLQTFNEKRVTPRQQAQGQSQERIKKESEYLRGQRENFLNGFSSPPRQSPTQQNVLAGYPNLQSYNLKLNIPQ